MKTKIVLFSVLAVLALFAVSAVPSASANGPDNEVYFVPEDSNGLYCENIPVQIMVDAVDRTTGAGMDIYFDPDCVNITDVDFTGSPYAPPIPPGWKHYGNYVRIGVVGPEEPIQPGTYLIANLTLHCEKETECTSNLAFDETELLDYNGDSLQNVIWREGTFSCGVPCIPSIEVNKTVLDKESQDWVDETTAQICENVRFRCEIHNDGTCCPLTNFVVTDILSESLEYKDNATVHFPDCTTVSMEPIMVDSTYVWKFPDLVLVPCETLTIEFDAHVVKCGEDVNTQTVTAVCVETQEEVFDEDTATVVVPPKPGIEVNKTVWDGTAWVDETTAEISENVRFRCEIHNNGTCCPLTNFVVTDILSASLEYADNATVNGDDWEPTIVNPNEFVWEFPDLVLVPCETITIEFDAHVIDYGYDCNLQKATAMCDEIEVYDEDTACVDVQNGQDNEVYFVPEDSYGLYCENISVLIMVYAVDRTTGAGMDIYFDPDCVNITDVDFTGSPYAPPIPPGWKNYGNYVRIGVVGPEDPIQPGTHLIANLTLHCENETTECSSDLLFEATELLDYNGDPLQNVIWRDGTFSCGVPCIPGIEVNKTVLDKESQDWVDETTAQICENVRFRCEIHNNGTCCPLTNLVVTDTLSDSLEYADNATVHFPDCTTVPMEPTSIVGDTYVWEFPDLVLLPCETITIEFDAHVIKCGVDVNTQTATAVCVETQEEVFDDDTATVIVPPKPGIEVNKTVWNGKAWVDETTAQISDTVRFRCEMHNNGTCCPLTNLVVTDTLSASLEYADNATVHFPDCTTVHMEPMGCGHIWKWEFPDLVLLPCETITIEFDAHVIDYGYDCNVQNATAMCEEIEVSDEDTACVDVPKLPDLTVTEITVNYDAPKLGGIAVGPEPGDDVYTECNNLSAVIAEENGVDVGSPFNVTFKVDGTTLCPVRVPGLTGGANKTVYCNCSWYPPYAGYDFAINVTVDSNHEISESNETNNTKWNNGTVVSNGYKGDGWQGPDKNLINVQCHEQDTNNLIYSVGDSYYAKGTWGGSTNYVANWTTSDLPVPEDADILKAWLYVYYCWDKNEIMPNGVSLTFNGDGMSFVREYSDRKGFGTSNYPYGMLVYDVTTAFIATGNRAVLTKPAPDTYIPIKGMLLMVVYNHPDEPERIICIDEGYDMINAQASYAVTPEEATTYAPFECCEPIPLSEIGKATLVAVAPGASMGDDKNRLSFNDGLWKGAWSGFAGATELGIAEEDVRLYLKEEDNVANFQDRGDWMEASNAFLILEKEAPCPAEYAVYQAKVSDPEGRLNELRALRDNKLEDGYVDRYYDNSPMLTLVLSRADSDLVTDGAQLLSKYSIPVGQHVQGMDVNERITKQDVEEALSFTERLKIEVLKNRDAIGAKSTEAIIVFIDEFEGQVKASEGKTFSAALKSSIYYEGGQLRVDQEIVEK